MKKIILLVFGHLLITLNLIAQTLNCNTVSDDFTNATLWTHPVLAAPLSSPSNYNTLNIASGTFNFQQSRDQNLNYFYRNGLAISDTDFKANIDFYHVVNGAGTGHVVLGLTNDNEPFFNSSLSPSVASLNPAIHNGIAVVYQSDLNTSPTDFFFQVHINNGGVDSQVGFPIHLAVDPVGTTNDYYLELLKMSSTTGILNLYNDAGRTMLRGSSGLFTIPSAIIGLTTVQFGTDARQNMNRMLTGKLDNLCIDNTPLLTNPINCGLASDDFSTPAIWGHPILPSPLGCFYNTNTMQISSGVFNFFQSRDNNFNYMNRLIPAVSNTYFKANIDFRHISNGPTAGGAGHTILALNDGFEPFFSSTSSVGSPGNACAGGPLVLSSNTQKGIAVSFESDIPNAPTNFSFKVYVNNGITTTMVSTPIVFPPFGIGAISTDYFLTLERTSATTGRLTIYSDIARMTSIGTSVFAIPASITNLNVAQFGANEWQEQDRMLTGYLDNLCITSTPDNCLSAKYYFDLGDTRDDLGHIDGINNGATLTTDRFGIPNSAYHFDGSLNQYIKVPNHSSNNFSNDFSISFWMLIDSTNCTDSAIISKHIPGTFNGYWFNGNTSNPGYCNGPGTYSFYTASGGMLDACANSLIANNYNVWMHIVGTYNNTTNQSKIYVNNVLQTDIGASSGTIANLADLILGGIEFPAGSFITNFHGKLDDVSLYQCELDATQVTFLFNEKGAALATTTVIKSTFKIYPNPAKETLNIQSESILKSVELFDMNGRSIKTFTPNTTTTTITLEKLAAGMYFVKVATVNGTSVQKVIKQ